MIRIFKYPLKIVPEQRIELPQHATVLSVGLDPVDRLCLWARVDDSVPQEQASVLIVGTGHNATRADDAVFLGTVRQGQAMWHIFFDQP